MFLYHSPDLIELEYCSMYLLYRNILGKVDSPEGELVFQWIGII